MTSVLFALVLSLPPDIGFVCIVVVVFLPEILPVCNVVRKQLHTNQGFAQRHKLVQVRGKFWLS